MSLSQSHLHVPSVFTVKITYKIKAQTRTCFSIVALPFQWEEINKWELNNGHSTPGSSCPLSPDQN